MIAVFSSVTARYGTHPRIGDGKCVYEARLRRFNKWPLEHVGRDSTLLSGIMLFY